MDPLELLTLVLILVTGFYAWQTRRTVVEMKRSREAQMLPKLAVELQPKYGTIATSTSRTSVPVRRSTSTWS